MPHNTDQLGETEIVRHRGEEDILGMKYVCLETLFYFYFILFLTVLSACASSF